VLAIAAARQARTVPGGVGVAAGGYPRCQKTTAAFSIAARDHARAVIAGTAGPGYRNASGVRRASCKGETQHCHCRKQRQSAHTDLGK